MGYSAVCSPATCVENEPGDSQCDSVPSENGTDAATKSNCSLSWIVVILSTDAFFVKLCRIEK